MPTNKDLKRLVRARMKKTGEAYTAARARIIAKPRPRIASPVAKPSTAPITKKDVTPAGDYAKLAGMSDAAIKENTGCTWEKWVYALDRRGADKMTHRQIADIVHDKYKVADWWTQTVTVGYERIKGLRARGQRRDGSYEASKSRTYNVAVETLFEAWAWEATRNRWLGVSSARLRTATSPKSMRLDGIEGGIVAVNFVSKGPGKSSVAVGHTKLSDRETATRLKKFWEARLDALGKTLKA